jgi:hypothetical protein
MPRPQSPYRGPNILETTNGLAWGCLHEFLGIDILEKLVFHEQGVGKFKSNFLRPSSAKSIEEGWVISERTILLAEAMYYLQDVTGFEHILSQMRDGRVESVYSELLIAQILWRAEDTFRFVLPKGRKGEDYDLEIRLPEGSWVAGETKSKLPSTAVTSKTVFNSLDIARDQVPSDRPSIVFLQIPGTWVWPPKDDDPVVTGIEKFFASGNSRIAAVFVHAVLTLPQSEFSDKNWQSHVLEKRVNPRCRFTSSSQWGILRRASPRVKWDSFYHLIDPSAWRSNFP